MARISDITLPNGTSYDVGQSTGAEFIRGTQTASTGSWTGVTTDSELYDGKEILYFLPYAGSGNATLNLTLKGGTTTGAKNCYFIGTSRLTTHYGANAVIRMTYHKSLNIGGTNYEGWWSEPGRDTDTHWTSHLYAGTGTAANASTTNGNTKITVADNSTARDSITIKGGGLSTVSSNGSGVVTIYTEDENAMHWLGYTTTNIYPGDYRTSITIVEPDGTIRESVTAHVGDVVSYTTNESSDLNQYNYPKYILDKSELWTLLSGESTDESVKQSPSTSNSDYEVIFAGTTGNNEYTGSVKKNTNLTFNPSTGNLQVTKINGVTVGSSPKFTDNNTKYGLSISGHTISLVEGGSTASVTVPDNDANNAVTQTATTTNAAYEVLFSATADNTTRTEGARKNSNLTFNPNTGNLQVTQINGVTVGSSPKFTDNNTTYGLSISDHTISLVAGGTTSSVTVPDNNTNNAVTQTAASDNNNYRVLLSGTADDTTRTEGAKKDGDFYYNPSTNTLTAYKIIGTNASGVEFPNGSFIHGGEGSAGNSGYVQICRIVISGTYVNSPIEIVFCRRGDHCPTRLSIQYANLNSDDPTLSKFGCIGYTNACYIVKSATSTWDLYITKSEAWDYISVLDYHLPRQLSAKVAVEWMNGFATTLPAGYTQASWIGNIANASTVTGFTVGKSVPSNAKFTDTTYTAQTTSIGSASAGTAIPADDITSWSAGTAASASVANGVLTITNGTAPALQYTAKSIPNISVASKTVVTGITAS